jgi:hypothetical protein
MRCGCGVIGIGTGLKGGVFGRDTCKGSSVTGWSNWSSEDGFLGMSLSSPSRSSMVAVGKVKIILLSTVTDLLSGQ